MKSKEKAIGITGKKLVYEGKTILKIRDSYMNGEGVLKIGGLLNMTETGEKMTRVRILRYGARLYLCLR